MKDEKTAFDFDFDMTPTSGFVSITRGFWILVLFTDL